ncbi:hypothetical protein A11A3_02957 [Alcanivorax hongdengensis A-11-3]|uniref:Uncharacterized protein n=1 Tax=Alcanivorax hongdengensis A-11-3 TaxID=1177179 RepID=L0WGE3_9GAMM|nr:hypothetical protein [Alcanivorax hongdengensis]EKF75794.1 hypothetical protein A11A3_02957 [Alcanivorax hongdengensis A-11-3]
MKTLVALCLLAGMAAIMVQPAPSSMHYARFDRPNGIVPAMPRSPDMAEHQTGATTGMDPLNTFQLNPNTDALRASIAVSDLNLHWAQRRQGKPSI